jgi:hypothetical protein
MGLSKRVRFVAILCIAVFAFTAITAMPALALFDAQTQVDSLFGDLQSVIVCYTEDVALPDAPALDVLATRGPPLS